MQKIKLNDDVIVTAGKDRNKKGKIKSINFKRNRVVIAGVNLVKKAIKPTQENPQGGIVEVESSIHFSNISLVSPKTGAATRVRIEEKDGKKVRVGTKCGSVIQ